MAKNATREELEKLEKEYKKELGLEHICYIYKITNLINNKKYIGLTTVSVESRWKKHMSESKKEANQSPLYCDMREQGIENFTIECIEECTLKDVQHREQYWIKYYNTFLDKTKGYNLSVGGELGLITKADEEVIVKTYKELKTIQKVCEELNIDHNRVSKILTKNGIKIKSPGEHQKEKGNTILQYDLEGNLLNTFQSRTEAGQWLIDNKLTTAKNPNDAGCLIRNILARDKNKYKGYYWKYENEYPQELKEKFLIRKRNSRTFSECPICKGNKDPKSIFCAKCRKEENMKNKANKKN